MGVLRQTIASWLGLSTNSVKEFINPLVSEYRGKYLNSAAVNKYEAVHRTEQPRAYDPQHNSYSYLCA